MYKLSSSNMIFNDFGHKRKNDHFDTYHVLLAIITNTPASL